jgi:WD40 repeat protein
LVERTVSSEREDRSVLAAFGRAIDQASCVLAENPELLFAQVYNRLRWEGADARALHETLESQRRSFNKPWLRLVSKPMTQGEALLRSLTDLPASECSFFPDGKMAVSSHWNLKTEEGTLRIWDTLSGKDLLILTPPKNYDGGCASRRIISLAPDGRRICQAAFGGRGLCEWDAETGALLFATDDGSPKITAFGYTPDGGRILSLTTSSTFARTSPGRVRVYESGNGKVLVDVEYQDLRVVDVVWSADEDHLICGCCDGFIKVLDVTSGEISLEVKAHSDDITCVASSPDRGQVLTGSLDSALKLWDAGTWQELSVFEGGGDFEVPAGQDLPAGKQSIAACGFLPESQSVVALSYNEISEAKVTIWDVQRGCPRFSYRVPASSRGAFAVSVDGTSIAVVRDKSVIEILDGLSGEEKARLFGHSADIVSVSFSPDGKSLLSAGGDGLKVWKADAAEQTLAARAHDRDILDLSYSRDGRLIVTAGFDETLKVWDSESLQEKRTLRGHTSKVVRCCLAPKGDRIISAAFDDTVRVWDMAAGEEIYHLNLSQARIKIGPDGDFFVTRDRDRGLTSWDTKTGREIISFSRDEGLSPGFDLSADGRLVVASCNDGTLRLWDTGSGKPAAVLRGHRKSALACVFSPDGRRILSHEYSEHEDSSWKIWDVQEKREIPIRQDRGSWVLEAAFVPDERRFVTAHYGWSMKIWRYDPVVLERELSYESGKLVISPDSRRAASGIEYENNKLELWDLETGERITVFAGLSGMINTVAFHPSGDRFAIGDSLGQLLVLTLENIGSYRRSFS